MSTLPRYVTIFLLFTCLTLQEAYSQVATFVPNKPVLGGTIALAYDAATAASSLKNPLSVSAEIMILREQQPPLLREIELQKSASLWKGSLKIDDPAWRLFLVRFVSGDQQVDDNGETCWTMLMHGADGKPVQGATLQAAVLYMSGGPFEFKHPRNAGKANELAQQELTMYPGNWQAEIFKIGMMLREKPDDDLRDVIKERLENLYSANKNNEVAVAALFSVFEQIGENERAESIKTEAFASHPKGIVAQAVRSTEMMRTRDPAKRTGLLETFVKDFPGAADIDNYRMMLVNTYVASGMPEKALTILESMPRPAGALYNSIARPLIDKEENVEKGTALAKKAVDVLRASDSVRPAYIGVRQWKVQTEQSLSSALVTYGSGLTKLKRMEEAEKALHEAYTLSLGKDPSLNEQYVQCLVANKNFDQAMAVSSEAMRTGKGNDKLRENYRTAYRSAKGTDDGFELRVKSEDAEAQTDLRKKYMKDRIDKPATDFSLRGLDGQMVRLTDLKGKVVVIDFWATWCGPCKASFPYLQKVYEAYKENPRVAIYALNAGERMPEAQRDPAVRKFLADNKYTFPVLYDVDTIRKYGVTGIPTKFVIDREGRIQFRSIGFEGGDAMVKELTTQIDLLLSDEFYSK